MSRRPALFTETDVQRAIKAAVSAGLTIGSVRIERDGAIVIQVPGKAKESALDKWLSENEG